MKSLLYPFHISWTHFRRRWIAWIATGIITLVIVVYLVISSAIEGIRYFWLKELVGARADLMLQVRGDPYGVRDHENLVKKIKKLSFVRGAAPFCENPCLFIHNRGGQSTTKAPGICRGIYLKEELENGRLKEYLETDDTEFKRFFPEEYWYGGVQFDTRRWVALSSSIKKKHLRALKKYIRDGEASPVAHFLYIFRVMETLKRRGGAAVRGLFVRIPLEKVESLVDAALTARMKESPEIFTDTDAARLREILASENTWNTPESLSADKLALLTRFAGIEPSADGEKPSPDVIADSAAFVLFSAELLEAYAAAGQVSPDEAEKAIPLPEIANLEAGDYLKLFTWYDSSLGGRLPDRLAGFRAAAPDSDFFSSMKTAEFDKLVAVSWPLDDEYFEEKLAQLKHGAIVGSTWRDRYNAQIGDTILVILGDKPEQSEQFIIQGFRRDAQARLGLVLTIDFRVAQRFFSGVLNKNIETTMTPAQRAKAAAVRGIFVWIKNLDFDAVNTDAVQEQVKKVFLNHVKNSTAYSLRNTGKFREFYYSRIETKTWKEFDPEWYASINRQNQIIRFLITAFLVLVGVFVFSINMVMVREKTRDIGLLRACGASRSGVASIFLLEGIYVGVAGIAVGVPVGIWMSGEKIINGLEARFRTLIHIPLNPNPGILDKIPTHLRQVDVLVITALTLAVAVLAALLPAVIAARVNPVKTLHHE